MPIYEFKCRKCNKITAQITQELLKPAIQCPHCGETADRIISRSNFICHVDELIKK